MAVKKTKAAEISGDDASFGATPEISNFFPAKGERAVSIGQTGSGKTTFNRWLLERLPESPIVIYDSKHDPKFDELKNNSVVETLSQADDAIENMAVDYVIFRPPPAITSSPQALDKLLQFHEENWRGVDAYIDELYHFHSGAYAGPGLNGLYTRGRSRGITTIGSTQRPALVSRFIFSETQLFYVFQLFLDDDVKKVNGFIRGFKDLPTPERHKFYMYRQGDNKPPQLMGPIPVADAGDLGYTDHLKDTVAAETDDETPGEDNKSGIVWL